jgi:drug/metabolite transporter (DMT)-like permease
VSPRSESYRAAGLVVLTMALFAVSDAVLKLLLGRLPIGELMFLRGVLVCLLILSWLLVREALPRRVQLLERVNLARALIELGVAAAFFAALRNLPLANATTLIFASPIIMTLLATVLLKERVGLRRWSAVIVGFLGVLIVAAPTAEGWSMAAVSGLLAAVLVAVRDLITRFIPPEIGAGAAALTTAATVTLGGALTLPFAWVPPEPRELLLIAASSLLIAVAYATIVMAFRRGELSFVAPFRYVSIPLSVVLGWLVFGDVPSWNMLLGAAIVAGSGVFIFHRERALARRATAG